MKYKKTKWEFIHVGSDGEMYTSYYPGYTKKKAKLRNGLKVITIRVNNNKKYISVAKEVALAFIPNPEGHRYVKEIDGDQMNTHPSNLYWSKSNRMDYKSFAKKKEGMVYKSYVDEVIGDYIVIQDDTVNCKLQCNNCKDTITVDRSKVRNKKVCYNCIDNSLDISFLSSAAFENWKVLKEDGTENLSNAKKKLIIECKCCGQKESVKYTNYKARKREYKCNILKEKERLLLVKFSNMKQRCYNPTNKSYKNYGERGITICKDWLDNSKNFIDWALSNGYENGLEIDRENNDKGYDSENCRWVTREVNNQNHSTNLLSEELVSIIKNTNWGDKDNRQIADELGFQKERKKYGRAISQVIRGNTWKNI
jgi:hypothetical protein